ncbi:hypothetical protein KUV44_12455 [Marinobacter daepoensis]|uniref:Uncharacterized protein n=1 Tax=Marinobacter daepoensis TaxID=262077 RepID=A0ABS3BHQ0_9GAMM|nr:hypothetical protein [Marinobacter daepoensis]MBN7771353.1 hypothetical protein [Marinobacter daepoensis]MBY6079954.1 hypothetical protein [Marinobacter daepoensis]
MSISEIYWDQIDQFHIGIQSALATVGHGMEGLRVILYRQRFHSSVNHLSISRKRCVFGQAIAQEILVRASVSLNIKACLKLLQLGGIKSLPN